jgi:hypothetical protein
MQDYFENYEIDDDSVRMKIFVQSLTGDVRTWFRALAANSIADPMSPLPIISQQMGEKERPLAHTI